MGSSSSCAMRRNRGEVTIKKEWIAVFKLLLLSREDTNKLTKMFREVCDDNGFADIASCLLATGSDQTAFSLKIFCQDGRNQRADLKQFVVCVWNFCSLNFEMLGTLTTVVLFVNRHTNFTLHAPARFVFATYDIEERRYVTLATIEQILTDNYDNKLHSRQYIDR